MEYPANALIVNGVVIAVLEEHTAKQLIAMADGGSTPAKQVCELEIPIKRDSFSVDREQFEFGYVAKTPVSKRQVSLTVEFIQRGQQSIERE